MYNMKNQSNYYQQTEAEKTQILRNRYIDYYLKQQR